MTTITQAINGTLTLITVGREIYEAVTELMDVVQAEGGNGSNKKAVMAATKHIILKGGRNWDKWEKYILDFIDAAEVDLYLFERRLLKKAP